MTCSLLFLTVPLLFGIPPLAARILWSDLSTVEFFKNAFKPEDLVYVGMVLKILPNGLLGFFLAAMFAATMSTFDTTYNIDSSIISRDLYGGLINRKATDRQIFLAGIISTVLLGIITIVTAIIYTRSELGIFNLMVVYVSLLSMPVGIPMVLGLVFKRLPRWSAMSAIALGLLISALAKFLLGWSVGPHIYVTSFVILFVFILSELLARLYRKNVLLTFFIIIFWTIVQFLFFFQTSSRPLNGINLIIFIGCTVIFGLCLFLFTRLFSKESLKDRMIVEEFFRRLAVPIDVAKEVYGGGRKQIATYPVVGLITMFVGLSILILILTPIPAHDRSITLGMGMLLLIIGILLYYFGNRSERNFNKTITEK